MEVPVHIQNSSSALLRFEGRGLQALKLNSSDSDCEVAVRSIRRRPFPGQLLFLSEDSVSLGDIPVLSPSSRIFFLTNVSNTDSVVYSWQLPLESGLQIRPERGRVGPGGCDLCVLTFTPSDYPAVYQLDLVCQVTPEAALTRYLKALDLWEQEKQRQLDGFTISDPNVSERQILLIEKEPTRLPRRLRKCKTLPPLHPTESFKRAETSCTKQGRAERKVQIWRRPEPPQPALLHLSVTAQSHTPEVYRTHLPERFRRHCRYLQLMDPRRTVSTSPPAGQLASLHRPGRDVTVNILNSLLRDILADSVFLQSLRSLASKAPFYRPAETSCCSPTPPTPPPAFGGATAGPTRTSSSERVPVHMAEAVLMNTFQNLMMTTVKGELGLTAPPRGVSVPPPSVRNRLSSRDRRQTDE